MSNQTFINKKPFNLECGAVLENLEISYTTYGELAPDGGNVVWIFHALTANSDPLDWWSGLAGHGKLFDPNKYFIVCANMLGSCYGSSGPLSLNPKTGNPYYNSFPEVTLRDSANAFEILRENLGVSKIKIGIGGSMGGQLLLEWAVMNQNLFETIIPVATNAKQSPWGIALNSAQRLAIEADLSWKDHSTNAGNAGLVAARATAIISYRNYQILNDKQYSQSNRVDNYPAALYIKHQGEKLAKRFNALSYWLLTKAMDSHDLGRGRRNIKDVLKQIRAQTIVIGISTDILFPSEEQRYIANHIENGSYVEIQSSFGHDGFLIEYEQLTSVLNDVLLMQVRSL